MGRDEEGDQGPATTSTDQVDGRDDLAGLRPRQLLRMATQAPDSYILLLALLVIDYVSLNVSWSGRAALIVRAALLGLTVLLAFHTSRIPRTCQQVVRVAVAIGFLVAAGAALSGSTTADGAEILIMTVLVLACPFAIGWRILHHRARHP